MLAKEVGTTVLPPSFPSHLWDSCQEDFNAPQWSGHCNGQWSRSEPCDLLLIGQDQ